MINVSCMRFSIFQIIPDQNPIQRFEFRYSLCLFYLKSKKKHIPSTSFFAKAAQGHRSYKGRKERERYSFDFESLEVSLFDGAAP